MKKLHAFMMRHLRSIMKIRWQDKVTNIKVLKRAGLPSMEDLLIRKNLRWTGHLLRMPTDRLPRQVLYSQLPDGQRPRGRARLRYKDTIKRNLKKRDIDTNSWKSLALQRDVWRDTVKYYWKGRQSLSHATDSYDDDERGKYKQQEIGTTVLALTYSTAEYAYPVWKRSEHAHNVNPVLNNACRSTTRCLQPSNIYNLCLLAGIAPPAIM